MLNTQFSSVSREVSRLMLTNERKRGYFRGGRTSQYLHYHDKCLSILKITWFTVAAIQCKERTMHGWLYY